MATSDDESLATLQNLTTSNLPIPLCFYELFPAKPLPDPTPAENAFLYHDIGEQVGATWMTLHNIVIRHEQAIIAAWDKKSTKRRLAILSTAWGSKIPEHNRPDWWFYTSTFADGNNSTILAEDSLFGTSSKKRTAVTYPYINESHLMQKRALPLLINTRARAGPDNFYQFNIRQTHLGRFINALVIPDLQGFRIDVTNEKNYGEIIPDTTTFHTYYLTAGETLMAMQIHIRVAKFLIRCCQLILNQNDLQILTSPNTPVPPEVKPPRKTVWMDVADVIWEQPLAAPDLFNSKRIIEYLSVRTSAAEDHIWDLRENPGYFAAKVLEWSEHQKERMCFPDDQDILETGTPEFWNIVIREVIADAFESVLAWQILYTQYHLIHERGEQNDLALSFVDGISPDCAEEMHVLFLMMNGIGSIMTLVAWCSHLVSPHYRGLWRQALGPEASPRKGCKPDLKRPIPAPTLSTLAAMIPSHNTASILMTMSRLLNAQSCKTFGFINLIDDVGYILASNPLENLRMSARSQKILSDLGLIASIAKEIVKHQTFCPQSLYTHGKPLVQLKADATLKMAPLRWIGKRHRDYSRLAALGTPFKGRFDYPVNERRTLEVNKRMQESEKNLAEFWKKADEEYKEMYKVHPLDDDMLECLAFKAKVVGRTRDWVEPKRDDAVDRELLIKELCESKLPKKKRKSKKSKSTSKAEPVSNLGVTKPLPASCDPSQGNENDPVNEIFKSSSADSKSLRERTLDPQFILASHETGNFQTGGNAAQTLQRPDNNGPKKLQNARADEGHNDQKGCERETGITTEVVPSQLEAQEQACEMKAKSLGLKVRSEKKTKSQLFRKKGLSFEHYSKSGDVVNNDLVDSCRREEKQIETESSVNTVNDTEPQKFECEVDPFLPGCAVMMSGGIFDEPPLTPECFSRIPDSEYRREVCPRRPALEALVSNKHPIDRRCTQAGKKPDYEPGNGCVLAAGPPKGNEENQPPLNLDSSQIPEPEYGRMACWAGQRRKSLDFPIQDESQRGRMRVQACDDEADTGLDLARGFFAENQDTDPEKWWSSATAAHRDDEFWPYGSGRFDKFSWYHWPTLGRPSGASDRSVVNFSGNDEEIRRILKRRPSLPTPTKESRFKPEGPLDSYVPLEAAAEIYNCFKPYSLPHAVGADPAIHDIYWEEGDSDFEEGPTWRHIEWKKVQDVPELATAPQDVVATKKSTSPISQLSALDDSSRCQSVFGDSQREGSLPMVFSPNTTVSPENPKLALAATEPGTQEAAILAYQQANQSLERFAAAQSEVGTDESHTLDFDISEDTQDLNVQLNEGEHPLSLSSKAAVIGTEISYGDPSWDKLSWDEKMVIWDERIARTEAAAAYARDAVSKNNWAIKLNETELTYMKTFNIYCLESSTVEVVPGLNRLVVTRLWTDWDYDGPLGIEAQDQDIIQAIGESATRNPDVDVREEWDVSAGDPGPELTVAEIWEGYFVGTGIETLDPSKVSGAQDSIQDFGDLAARNSSSQMANAHFHDVIAEDLKHCGSCFETESPQYGLIASAAEGQDIFQAMDESSEGELALVNDRKLRREKVSIAIPWNLKGVRRGMKIPDIKWPTLPKPLSAETVPELLEQDESPKETPSEELEYPELERDEEELQPTALIQSEEAEPKEPKQVYSPEQPPSEELQSQGSPEDQIVGQESSEAEPKCKEIDKHVNSHSRKSPMKPRPSKSSRRGTRKQKRQPSSSMGLASMQRAAAMTYKDSPEEGSSAADIKAMIDMVQKVIEAKGLEDQEQFGGDLAQMIASKATALCKDQDSTNSTIGGVTSNVSTEKKNATEAPHGYPNAYTQKSPLTDLVADQEPKNSKQEDLDIARTLLQLKGDTFDRPNDFASKLNGMKDKTCALQLRTPNDEESFCGSDSGSDSVRDSYYVSKASHKVFMALFHDAAVDKTPRPSFMWSEFLTAMMEIEFMPSHEYGTLWHFALKAEGMGIQLHQPHYQGMKKDVGLSVKVSPEYSWVIAARLERNYGYQKGWFFLKDKEKD